MWTMVKVGLFSLMRAVLGMSVIIVVAWGVASTEGSGSLDKLLQSNYAEEKKSDDDRLSLENKILQLEQQRSNGRITSAEALSGIIKARCQLLDIHALRKDKDKYLQTWQWVHDRIVTDKLYADEQFYEGVGNFLVGSTYSLSTYVSLPDSDKGRVARQTREVYKLFVPFLDNVFTDDKASLQYYELYDWELLLIECSALSSGSELRPEDVVRVTATFEALQKAEVFRVNQEDHSFVFSIYFENLGRHCMDTGNPDAWEKLIQQAEKSYGRLEQGTGRAGLRPMITAEKWGRWWEIGEFEKIIEARHELALPESWHVDDNVLFVRSVLDSAITLALAQEVTSNTHEAAALYTRVIDLYRQGEKLSPEITTPLHYGEKLYAMLGLLWTTPDAGIEAKVSGEIDSLIKRAVTDATRESDYMYPSICDYYMTSWIAGKITTNTLATRIAALPMPDVKTADRFGMQYMQSIKSVLADGSRENVMRQIEVLEKYPMRNYTCTLLGRYELSRFLPEGDAEREKSSTRLLERGINPEIWYPRSR